MHSLLYAHRAQPAKGKLTHPNNTKEVGLMKRPLTTVKAKTTLHLLILSILFVYILPVGTLADPPYDYQAEFIQMASWLTTQQVTSGGNLGGIVEG
jgi:hypothetical protein